MQPRFEVSSLVPRGLIAETVINVADKMLIVVSQGNEQATAVAEGNTLTIP